MRKNKKRPTFFALVTLTTIATLGASSSNAGVYSWSGSSGATWSTSSTNWATGGGPMYWDLSDGSLNVADFKTSGASANVSGSIYVNGIQFDSNAAINGGTINLVDGNILAGSTFTTPTITVNASSGTIGAILSGTGGLSTGGSGSLLLTGVNTFSGSTAIDSGTLTIGGRLGSGTYASAISNSGALIYNGTAAQTLSGPIGGAGSLTDSGTATLTLSGANTYFGSTTINGATLKLSSTGALGATSGISLANSGVLSFAVSGMVIGAPISIGSGTTFTSALSLASSLTTAYLNGPISGSGDLTIQGTVAGNGYNWFVLGASNSYAGNTTFQTTAAGNLLVQLAGSGATLPASTVLTLNCGAPGSTGRYVEFDLNGNNQQLAGLTSTTAVKQFNIIVNSSTTASTLTITNTANYNYSGMLGNSYYNVAGTPLFVSGNNFGLNVNGSAILTLSGSSSYTGGTTVSSGTLQIGSAVALGASTALTVNGGALDLQGNSLTVGSLSGRGGTILSSNYGGSLVVDASTGATTYAGTLSDGPGQLSVINSGNSLLTLLGSNNYTGNTAISAGTLVIGGAGILGGGNYSGSISNSGAFVFNSTSAQTFSGQISGSGSWTVAGTSTLTLGALNNSTGVTMIQAGTLQIGGYGALQTSDGSLVINGGTLDLNGFSPSTNAVTLAAGSIINSGAAATLVATGFTLQSGTANAILDGSSTALNKTTTGLAVLAASNTYGGGTTISAGTLQIAATGALGNGGLSIIPGGMLDVSPFGSAGYNFNASVLTAGRSASLATDIKGLLNVNNSALNILGTGSSGTLTVTGSMDLSGSTLNYVAGDLVKVSSALMLSGTDYIYPNALLSGGTSGTTYTLFTFNSLPSGGTANLAMGGAFGAASRQNYTFGLSGGTAVTLTVKGVAANLVWRGGTWDTGVSKAWYNTTSGTTDMFFANDNVTFDDSAGSASGNITTGGTSGSVQPGTITFSNTAVNYTLSGVPIAGIATLLKRGPGALTLNSGNTYAGGTTLSGGLLNIGDPAALGSGPVNITGGSLDNTTGGPASLTFNNAENWSGNFTFLGSNPLSTGSGAVTLSASTQVNVNANSLMVGGTISGSGGLTKTGTGILNLSASNSYGGNTTIGLGVLQIGTPGAIPSGANTGNVVFGSAANSAVLDLNGNDTTINGLSQPNVSSANMVVNNNPAGTAILSVGNNNATSTFSGVLADNTGTGGILALTKVGTGTLTLAGSIAYSGLTNISAGTLAIYSSSNQTFAGTISGSGSLTASGPAMLTLSGLNNYTGNTQISNGTLAITGGPLGGGAYAGAISNSGTFIYGGNAAQTLSGPISGSGSLIDSGVALTLTLGGSNSYTGSTTVDGNVLSITNTAALAGTSGISLVNQSVLSFGVGGVVTGAPITIGSGSTFTSGLSLASSVTTAYLNGPISGSGDLTIQGTIAGNGHNWFVLGGSDSYAGNTTFQTTAAGNLLVQLASSGAMLPASTVLTLNCGAPGTTGRYVEFDLNGNNQQLAGLTSTTAVKQFNIIVNSSTSASALTISNTADYIYSGMLGNSYYNVAGTPLFVSGNNFGLNVNGSAILTLSGSSSFSGGTRISSGTLQLGNTAALGTGGLTVNAGVLDLGGQSIVVPSLSGSAGIITDNSFIGSNVFSVSQSSSTTFGGTIADGPSVVLSLSKSGSGILTLTGSNTFSGGTTVANGTLVLDGAASLLAGSNLTVGVGPGPGAVFSTPLAATQTPSAAPQLSAVPEPGTFMMLAIAAITGLGIWQRRTTK